MIDRQKGLHKSRLLYWVVLSLVFVLPLTWRNSFASTFGQLLGYITIIVILVAGLSKHELKLSTSVAFLFGIAFFWIIISILDSIRFYAEYGTLSGEDTFTAPLGSIYYHLYYISIFSAYIALVRNGSEIEPTLKKAFNTIVWIQLISGFVQLLIVLGLPGISEIYDGINFLEMLPTASFIRGMSRITMTGSEPASMGVSLGMLSFPYLFAVMQGTESAKEKTTCGIKLSLLIVLSYFSKSTTVFAIMAFSAAIYVLWSSREGKLSKRNVVIGLLIIIAISLLLVLSSFGGMVHIGGDIIEELHYYLLVKPTDTANMSTMHRLSPTVNDIAIIKEHPLLGVGDGNQGFTYGQNVPSYMLINPKSKDFAKGIGGVVNGGAWFWAILSGYGIIGVLPLLIWYYNVYRPRVRLLRASNLFLYRIFIYALPAIILTLLAGAMEPTIVFILSFPFWEITDSEQELKY